MVRKNTQLIAAVINLAANKTCAVLDPITDSDEYNGNLFPPALPEATQTIPPHPDVQEIAASNLFSWMHYHQRIL